MGPDSPLGSRDLSLESLLRSLLLSPSRPAASRMNSAQAHPAPSAGRSRATRATADTARPRPVRRLPGQLSDDPHALVVVRGRPIPHQAGEARPAFPDASLRTAVQPQGPPAQIDMPVAPSGIALQAFPVHVTASDALGRPNAASSTSKAPARKDARHVRTATANSSVAASPSSSYTVNVWSLVAGDTVGVPRTIRSTASKTKPVGNAYANLIDDCTVTAGRTSSPGRVGRQPGRRRRRQRVHQRCGTTCASPKLGRDTPPTPKANRNSARSPSESTTVSVYQVDACVAVGVPATIRAAG